MSLSVLCVVMELAGIELKTLRILQLRLSTLPIELSDPAYLTQGMLAAGINFSHAFLNYLL